MPGSARVLAALGDWGGRRIGVRLVDAASTGAESGARLRRPDHRRGASPRRSGRGSSARSSAASSARMPTGPSSRSPGCEVPTTQDRPGTARPDRPAHGRRRADGGGRRARRRCRTPTGSSPGSRRIEGVGRRFELKGEVDGVVVLDDYAHHPTAMRATFEAARRRYPGRRLWAVYEPLTYHRTAAMLDAFAEVLAEADRAAIIDIWAVRDPDTTITSAAALAEATTRLRRHPGRSPSAPRKPRPTTSRTTSSRATSSSSWVAAARTWRRTGSSTLLRSRTRRSLTASRRHARRPAIIAAVSTARGRRRAARPAPRRPVVPPRRVVGLADRPRIERVAVGRQARPDGELPAASRGAAHVMTPSSTSAKRVRSAFMCGQRRWTL